MTTLAIDGGEPVRSNKLPISRIDLGDEEVEAASAVIRSGWVTEGPKSEAFEKAFASYIGTKHAIVTSSGTSALHILTRALGIKPGEKIVVPSFTFIASANCALFEQALPVFAEVYGDTYNIDIDHLSALLKKESPRALLAVDMFGQAANWNEIKELADTHDLLVIEDAAQAHGAEYHGKKCGNFGHAAAFSFYPTKNMTTGEGGMITTNDETLATAARKIKNHGRITVREDHEILGYTYRISDILSAIGLAQLKKLPALVEKRRSVAHRFTKALSGVEGIVPPVEQKHNKHAYMNYVARFSSTAFTKNRDHFVAALNAEGISSKVYFSPPVHLQPLYRTLSNYKGGELPVTEKLSSEVFSLPMSATFDDQEVTDVIAAVEKVAAALRK